MYNLNQSPIVPKKAPMPQMIEEEAVILIYKCNDAN